MPVSEANKAAKAALEEIKTDEGSGKEDMTEETVSEIKQEAAKHGWTEEGVEGKLNLSAEEFMDRQVLYDDIKRLKKDNRRLQQSQEAIIKSQTVQAKLVREQTIAELTEQKKSALASDDYDGVVAIDERIAEARTAPIEPQQNNEVFEMWQETNEWYHENKEMREYADIVGEGYFKNNPDKKVSDVYKYVEKAVRKQYPEEFDTGNTQRTRQSSVEGAGKGRAASGTAQKYSRADLPAEHVEYMKTILRAHPKMTEAEYLKSYFS